MRYGIMAALMLALIAAPALAQDTNQQMIEAAREMRKLADSVQGTVDAAQVAELRRTADEMEKSAREAMAAEATSPTTAPAAPAAPSAAYTAKENLAATAACSGFTEQNYRQLALSGGNDVQLKTMCGQAFEYYTMYKRAIAQGYSEADAERTYDAHRKSALVANDFYANNRAE